MLRIGICTKRETFEHYMEDLLGNLLLGYDRWILESIPVSVLLEEEAGQFLDYHIFCLDEQLLQQRGIDPVTYLSRIRPEASILLLEGEEEKGFAGIRYHLFVYQMERMKRQDLKTVLDRQWHCVNSTPRSLAVELDGKPVFIPMEQILFIESSNRRIILHTLVGEYEYFEKMYVLEELLREDDFVRCHQSFIVSKRFVTGYNGVGIWLDQTILPVGRKYKEQIQKIFAAEENSLSDDGKQSEKQGVLFGVKGVYEGVTLQFRPEEKILLGRDGSAADIVVNLPSVSRLHCVIVYHETDNTYEIVDFSKNGTYLSGRKRLVPDTTYSVKAGTRISFGDCDNVYCLG